MEKKKDTAKNRDVHIMASPGCKIRAYRKVKEGEAELILTRLHHRLHSKDTVYASFIAFGLAVLFFTRYIGQPAQAAVLSIACFALLAFCICGIIRDRRIQELFLFGAYHVVDVKAYEVLPSWSSDAMMSIRVCDSDGHYLYRPMEVEREAALRAKKDEDEPFLLAKYYYHGKSRFLCFSADPDLELASGFEKWNGRYLEKYRRLKNS